MTTEAQKRAYKRYYQKTKSLYRAMLFRFNKKDDADVLARIESAPNRTDYIRRLVREDIARYEK